MPVFFKNDVNFFKNISWSSNHSLFNFIYQTEYAYSAILYISDHIFFSQSFIRSNIESGALYKCIHESLSQNHHTNAYHLSLYFLILKLSSPINTSVLFCIFSIDSLL